MFGQVSALSSNDINGLLITLLLISIFIVFNFKQLLVTGFDPQFSKSIGIPNDFLQFVLWMLVAFCVISSLQLVGVILVSAMLVIPAATTSLFARRMKTYLLLSSILGLELESRIFFLSWKEPACWTAHRSGCSPFFFSFSFSDPKKESFSAG